MILEDLLVQDYPLVFKDSVVILDGIPSFVCSFNGTRAECLNIGSQDYYHVDFKQVKEVKMPNTGLVNHRGVVVNLTRIPCRRYKHGLFRENIQVAHTQVVEAVEGVHDKIRDALSVCKNLAVKTLYNTYVNSYPSLDHAIDLLQDGAFQIAFDRQFSVDQANNIFYKDKNVGVLVGGNKIAFQKQYEHLRISLPKGLK